MDDRDLWMMIERYIHVEGRERLLGIHVRI